MQFGLSCPPLLVSLRHDQTSLIINGVQTTLVFDVYGSRASTKQTEQRIRAERCTCSDMQYVTTTPQATFYTNIYSKKKQRLVSKRMHNGGHMFGYLTCVFSLNSWETMIKIGKRQPFWPPSWILDTCRSQNILIMF